MNKKDNSRKVSWSESEDARLTEIVLEHIKEGNTQLKAFEEAAKEFGRTTSACGFRWNSELRKNAKELVLKAKQLKNSVSSAETIVEERKLKVQKTSPNTKKQRSTKREVNLEKLLSPDKLKEINDYVQALSANMSVFQDISFIVAEKDKEITNLRETIVSQKEQIKRLQYLEDNFKEFSMFAERFTQKG